MLETICGVDKPKKVKEHFGRGRLFILKQCWTRLGNIKA